MRRARSWLERSALSARRNNSHSVGSGRGSKPDLFAGPTNGVAGAAKSESESQMPADQGAGLRYALKTLQDERVAGESHGGEAALERALLTTAADDIDSDRKTVAIAVRLLRPADDSGTTRLEVRNQAMTHRRWFEIGDDGEATWGDR
jgi:hypothetical protein